jgi:transposase-like protein
MDDVLTAHQFDQSACTSSRWSGRSAPIEIITRHEQRRWSVEQKCEIVAESLGQGLRPTEVARKHGISSGQLYRWRFGWLTEVAGLVGTAFRFV